MVIRDESKPRSYLFVCDGIGLGGLEMQMAARAIDAVARGGWAVLVCSRKGRLWEYAKQLGIELHHIEFRLQYLDPYAISQLGKLMKQVRADVCIVGQSHLLSQALTARSIWKLPLKVVFYQMMQSGHPKRDWFHNRVYSSLDAAIVLTNQMKEELARTTVMQVDRIHVIPFGIHLDQFTFTDGEKKAARTHFNLLTDAFIIGCIGRLDEQKDQMLLLNAFAASNLPANSILVLAGEETAGSIGYKAALQNRTEELEIIDKVMFLPFTSEVPKLMSCFDVFVLPSRSETFGLVVIEAMAASLPVVATASGGVPEIIEHGRTGLLFQPGDEAALAAHLTALAANPELRLSLGTEARRAAVERYDYERQTGRFFEVCRGCF